MSGWFCVPLRHPNVGMTQGVSNDDAWYAVVDQVRGERVPEVVQATTTADSGEALGDGKVSAQRAFGVGLSVLRCEDVFSGDDRLRKRFDDGSTTAVTQRDRSYFLRLAPHDFDPAVC